MWEGPGHSGCCHPWAGGTRWYKRVGWETHEKEVSKQHPSMVSASISASRFLPWVPALTSLCDSRACKLKLPLLSQVAVMFSHSNRNLIKSLVNCVEHVHGLEYVGTLGWLVWLALLWKVREWMLIFTDWPFQVHPQLCEADQCRPHLWTDSWTVYLSSNHC